MHGDHSPGISGGKRKFRHQYRGNRQFVEIVRGDGGDDNGSKGYERNSSPLYLAEIGPGILDEQLPEECRVCFGAPEAEVKRGRLPRSRSNGCSVILLKPGLPYDAGARTILHLSVEMDLEIAQRFVSCDQMRWRAGDGVTGDV